MQRMLRLLIIIGILIEILAAAHQERSRRDLDHKGHVTGHIGPRITQPAQRLARLRALRRRQMPAADQRRQVRQQARQQRRPHFILQRRLLPHDQGHLRRHPDPEPAFLVSG